MHPAPRRPTSQGSAPPVWRGFLLVPNPFPFPEGLPASALSVPSFSSQLTVYPGGKMIKIGIAMRCQVDTMHRIRRL
jgi:hypothetical protein